MHNSSLHFRERNSCNSWKSAAKSNIWQLHRNCHWQKFAHSIIVKFAIKIIDVPVLLSSIKNLLVSPTKNQIHSFGNKMTSLISTENFLRKIFQQKASTSSLKVKWNAQFIFLCNLQKSSINVCLINLLKKHCHKNVTVFLAAFIFSTSIMVFFEIHQKFEGHF